MRFLIVDGSSQFRSAAAGALRSRWPQAQVEDWDPAARGNPAEAVLQGDYSAVLLECTPAGQDGTAWAAQICCEPSAPPVVMLAQAGGENLAVQAMRAGAADFLSKRGLSAQRLVSALEQALSERKEHTLARTVTAAFSLQTVPLKAAAPRAKADAAENLVPGYRIVRMIGRGGQAEVYLAEREHDGKELVLKVLDPQLQYDATLRQRFVREFKLIASIQSEYVARIYDQGFAGEHPFIAMEYFPGGTLAAKLHEGIAPRESLRIVAQLARALDAIHSRGIVHRDLKPQNIMFRPDGRPAIVDFGFARDLASISQLTRVGEILATPRYMSPEQCVGEPADARSDLYSLGVIFYEMLSGHRLYEDENPAGLVYMHVHGGLPQLPEQLRGLQPILDRLLAKAPADRFQSARELFATIAV